MDKQLYTPRQVARTGWIRRPRGSANVSSNYLYILKQIKDGKLKPDKQYGTKRRKYYLLTKKRVDEFNKKY